MAQVAHCGIVKSNTAAELVQEFTTLALVHGFPVVVLHTVIVAAAQSVPSFQSAQSLPSVPSLPSSPFGH